MNGRVWKAVLLVGLLAGVGVGAWRAKGQARFVRLEQGTLGMVVDVEGQRPHVQVRLPGNDEGLPEAAVALMEDGTILVQLKDSEKIQLRVVKEK